MGITQKDLDQCHTDHCDRLGGHKNDYFALLYLTQEFGGKPLDYEQHVAFGNHDYGLDAFHIDRERRNLYLYQFKWTESHTQFKDSMTRLYDAGLEMVFGDPKQDKLANAFVNQLKGALDEDQALIDRVYIRFVFNGDPDAADNNKALDASREDLEAKRFLIDQFFAGRQVAMAIEFVSNETKKKGAAVKAKKTHSYAFQMTESIDVALDSKGRMHVGFIPLMALHRMHVEMGARLFNRNIRMGLGGERPTNRAIKASLRDIAEGVKGAEEFAFDHNGVTLSAEQFKLDGSRAHVVEPRVLNGAQTITTVSRYLEDQAGNKLGEQGLTRLEDVFVLARILETSSTELITRVTLNNNRQNPVEPWHLRASDRIQLELEDKFRDDLKLYYERQENALEALSDSELEDMGIEHVNQAIEIKRLAQTFLAVQGEIDRMSRLTEVFDIQKQYEDCFRSSYLKASSPRIVLCYKVYRRLRRLADEIEYKGGKKYFFVHRAKNLIWALTAQALLNADQVADWAERWGTNLQVDADYGDLLKDLASKRVRMILSVLLSENDVADQIADDRYGFLRTKATFARCMDVAHDKWGWTKRSF